MLSITRNFFEAMADSAANRFKHLTGKNLAVSAKRVELTANEKIRFENVKSQSVAGENDYQLYLQGKLEGQSAPPSRSAPGEDIYTKLGKMSSEERSAWVQNNLDKIAKLEALATEAKDKYHENETAILAEAQPNKVDTTA